MDTGRGRQSPTVSVILPYEDTKGPEAVGRESGGMVSPPGSVGASACGRGLHRRPAPQSRRNKTSVRTQNR